MCSPIKPQPHGFCPWCVCFPSASFSLCHSNYLLPIWLWIFPLKLSVHSIVPKERVSLVHQANHWVTKPREQTTPEKPWPKQGNWFLLVACILFLTKQASCVTRCPLYLSEPQSAVNVSAVALSKRTWLQPLLKYLTCYWRKMGYWTIKCSCLKSQLLFHARHSMSFCPGLPLEDWLSRKEEHFFSLIHSVITPWDNTSRLKPSIDLFNGVFLTAASKWSLVRFYPVD